MKHFFPLLLLSFLACPLMAEDAVTPVEFKADSLIIFQSKSSVKSGWFWKDNGSGKVYNTTVVNTSGSWMISFYDNRTSQFNRCIPFGQAGTDGSASWPGFTKLYNNDIVKNIFDDPDGNWLIKVSSTSSMSQSAFTHLGATIALSAEQIAVGDSVAITYTELVGSLNHETNDKWNIFVRKDAEDLVRLLGTEENFSFLSSDSVSFAPTEAGTYVLSIYLTDPYGLETIRYEKTLIVTGSTPTGLDNSSFFIQDSKFLKEGHLYIRRGTHLYDASGRLVE